MKNFTFILLLSLLSCKNSDSNRKLNTENIISVTDNDIYEIVNFVLDEHDKAMKVDGFKINPYKYILDKDIEPLFNHGDSIVLVKTDTLFSKEDLLYIEKQINNRKNFRFKSNFIKSKKIISAEIVKSMLNEKGRGGKSFYEIYERKFGKDMFYTIGLPVFSKNKKIVFIKFDSFGSGKTLIYKKVNNKWKYYCSISDWIA